MPNSVPVVRASAADVAGWSASWPVLMRAADLWARWAPRARGAVPRFVGRRFGRAWRVEIVLPDGARLAVEPSSLDMYLQIASTGHWDGHVLQVCKRLLSPGQVFYDIGANVGFMSVSTAIHFDDGIEVIAFEPQPELAVAIARSARLSNLANLEVVCAMLGSEAGEAELFVGAHSIHASAIPRETGCRAVRCPTYTVDGLVESGAIPPPDVIKIDVEGAELRVFEGAAEVLRRHRPAIVFEADENLLRFGNRQQDIMAFLSELAGYRIYGVMTEPLRLVALDPHGSCDPQLRDFLALAADAVVPDLR